MGKPYLSHLNGAEDLRTSYDAIRAGFVALALEKNRRATPHISLARALQEAASHAAAPMDLLKLVSIQSALVTAAGISDKALGHLDENDKRAAVLGLIENFLEPAGEKFVEELVFRFLLVRGDTLGGSMRNVGGFLAQCRLARALIAQLRLGNQPFRYLHAQSRAWLEMPAENDAGIELGLRGLSWKKSGKPRMLLYNVKAPVVRNSIDVVLLKSTEIADAAKMPSLYVALGELKGGIDPAGADEHWKTAATALTRIRGAFAKEMLNPHTFFIGAAIEAKMSEEIWQLLKSGVLANAANLTSEMQLASIARWLCSL